MATSVLRVAFISAALVSTNTFGNWFSDVIDNIFGDDERTSLYSEGKVEGYLLGYAVECGEKYNKYSDLSSEAFGYEVGLFSKPEYRRGHQKGYENGVSACRRR
jgi:hypothetical protein